MTKIETRALLPHFLDHLPSLTSCTSTNFLHLMQIKQGFTDKNPSSITIPLIFHCEHFVQISEVIGRVEWPRRYQLMLLEASQLRCRMTEQVDVTYAVLDGWEATESLIINTR
jgi:hypothetical protein